MKRGLDYIGVSVGAMIFNESGEILLAKRGKRAKNERGCWENPGGALEYGEKLEEGMRREIREEFGIEVEVVEQMPAHDHLIPKEKQHWVATTFVVKIKPGEEPKILEPEKCDEIGWFFLNDLPAPLSIVTQADMEYYRQTRFFP